MEDTNKTKDQLISDLQQLRRELTDLKEIEKKHKQTEVVIKNELDRNRLILQTTMDGYILGDPDGKIIDVNPAYCDMSGYSREELMQMNIREVEVKIPSEEVDQKIKQMTSLGHDRFETQHKRKDGSVFDMDVSISIMELDGVPMVAAFMRDITERLSAEQARKQTEEVIKKSEANLKSLIENRKESIWSIDKDYKYITFNEKFKNDYYLAYQKQLEKGINSIEILSPELRDFWKPKYDTVLTGKSDVFEFSERIGDKPHFYQVLLNPIVVEGNITGVSAISLDISERKHAERTLRELTSRNEAILAAVPDIIMEVDQNKIYTWANKAGFEFFGADVLGKEAAFYFEGQQETYTKVQPLFDGSEDVIYIESWQRRQDGEKRLLAWWCRVTKDQSGNVTGVLATARDITESKKTEEALRDSEEYLSNLMNAVADPIFTVKMPERKIEFINDSVSKVFGYEAEEVIGNSTRMLYPNSDQYLEFGTLLQKALKKNEPQIRFEQQMICKDGRIIWTEIITTFIFLNDEPHKVISVIRDISVLKHAEETLKISERRLSTLMGNLPGMAYRCLNDQNYTMKFVSEGSIVLTSYHPADLVNNKKIAYGQLIMAEDREQIWKNVQKALKKKEPFQFIYRITTKNGNEKWAWEKGCGIFSPKGELQALEGFITDISDLKQAEEKIRENETLLAEMSRIAKIGAWEFDAVTLEGKWTDEIAHIHDLDPAEKTDVQEGLSFYEGKSQEIITQAVKEAIELGKPYNLELELKTAKGNQKWVRTIGHPIKEKNQVVTVRGIFQDITERKQAEIALQKLSTQLRALSAHLQSVREEERSAIAREIHDELAQVLTVLKMDLSIMGRDIKEKNKTIDSTLLLQDIKSMTGLIDSTIQKVRKLITELRPEVLDNLGIIPTLEWQVQEFQAHTGIVCKFLSDLSEIDLERERSTAVYRIFQEALTNIARHAKATQVNIELKKSDGNLILRISDNGIGIPKNKIESPNTFGLLGMRERILIFGGEFDIKGRKGIGTTLDVKIPVI